MNAHEDPGSTNPDTVPGTPAEFHIAPATTADVPDIMSMIRALAEYEKLSHLCVATEADIARQVFITRRIEVLLGWRNGRPVCFALFFHNFSTFVGKPGLYLEDLFVLPEFRRHGYARKMLVELARRHSSWRPHLFKGGG